MATGNTHGNPELFTAVWLDTEAYNEENRATQAKLENAFDKLVVFQDEDECDRYIGRGLQQQRLVLIVSGQLGQVFVPKIHGRNNVLSIYVYCQWKEKHEKWARDHTKVKAVVTTLDDLISRIKSDQGIA